MFETVKNVIQLVALAISIVLNSILTYLIVTKSNQKMGSYKYIMMYFSLSALCYSALSLIVRPDVLTYSSCFVVFVRNSTSLFRSDVMIYLMSFICGFYFFFASLIDVHFVYRYYAIKYGSKLNYFRGRFVVFWFLLSPLLYANWTINCLVAFQPNYKSSAYLRPRINEEFGLEIEQITYIIADFYYTDEIERITPNMTTFISGANFLIMTIFSLSVMFVYAFKCYKEMKRVVAPGKNISANLKALHTQLFRALVFQSLIPLCIMYIPLFVLFIFPMLNINVGSAHYISISISVYPALDALPTLLLIRDYRDSIAKCLKLKKNDESTSFEAYCIRRNSLVGITLKKDIKFVNTIHLT